MTDEAAETRSEATKRIQAWAHEGSYVLKGAGAELYYELVGDPEAPLLFYLHGGPGYNSYSFRELVGESLQHYRVVYADQRGAGRSLTDVPDSSLQLETLAQDVLNILDQLETETVTLLAHGFGAMIACTLAYHAPERVRGMLLFNPWLDMPTLAAKAYQLAQDVPHLEALPEGTPAEWVQQASQRWGNKGLFDAMLFASPSTRMQLEHVDSGSSVLFQTQTQPEQDAHLWNLSVMPLLAHLRTPTILMVGQQDKSCYPEQAELLLSKMPQAQVAIVEGGHYPWLAAPDFEPLLQECLVMLRRMVEEAAEQPTSFPNPSTAQ